MTHHRKQSIIFFVFLILVLLPQVTNALNLGTLQKSNTQNVIAGDMATFDILFWNTEFDGYNVFLETMSAPKDWTIIINPFDFYLGNTSFGKIEHIYIPRIKKPVSASVINVHILVPKTTRSGKYTIILKATSNDKSTSLISLKQERLFFYEINVFGNNQNDNNNNNNESVETINAKQTSVLIDINPNILHQTNISKLKNQSKSINYSNNSTKTFLFFASIILIIFIAWRIYAHD